MCACACCLYIPRCPLSKTQGHLVVQAATLTRHNKHTTRAARLLTRSLLPDTAAPHNRQNARICTAAAGHPAKQPSDCVSAAVASKTRRSKTTFMAKKQPSGSQGVVPPTVPLSPLLLAAAAAAGRHCCQPPPQEHCCCCCSAQTLTPSGSTRFRTWSLIFSACWSRLLSRPSLSFSMAAVHEQQQYMNSSTAGKDRQQHGCQDMAWDTQAPPAGCNSAACYALLQLTPPQPCLTRTRPRNHPSTCIACG